MSYDNMLWILSVILAPEPINKYVFMDRHMDQSIYGVEGGQSAFQVPYVGIVNKITLLTTQDFKDYSRNMVRSIRANNPQ